MFFSFYCFSQNTKLLEGVVLGSENSPLFYVSVQLIELESDNTILYTTTNENGYFALKVNTKYVNKTYLKITHLGYETFTEDLKSFSKKEILLKDKTTELKSITIKSNYRDFQQKNDTISYNLTKIRDSTETNLKDLVEKLSGLTIDDDKKVNFQGKVIHKVVIDGEDFFGKKHEMSTENLPAEAVKGIQIIKNFKEFDDVGNRKTGKIVLNVTLNKNYKNKIVGNVELNYGVVEKNQLHTNLFKFVNKGNFALITEANNVGESAINMLDYIEMQGGIGNFTSNYNEGGSGVYEIDHAKIPRYVFVNKNVDARNTVFNSLNFSKKFSEKLKINGYITFDYTKIEELKNSTKNFADSKAAPLIENESNTASSYLANSFVNIVYKQNDNEVLKYNLKINPLNNDEFFNITGDLNLGNSIADEDFLFGQSLTYKNQLSTNLLLNSFITYDYKAQDRVLNLNSDAPFLNLDFLGDFKITQNTDIKQNTLNFYSSLAYEVSSKTRITSSISFTKNNENFYNDSESQSDFLIDVRKKQHSFSYFNTVNLKLNSLLSLNTSLNYMHNSLKINLENEKYNWFLPNVNLGFKFADEKNASISFSKSIKNISIFQMNTNFRVLNYQTKINKNDDFFTPVEKESINFNYTSINDKKNSMLSITASLFDSKNEIGFSSKVKNNFIEQTYIRVPQKGFDISLNQSKTLKKLPLRLNAKFFYSKTSLFSFFESEKNKNKVHNYGVDVRFQSTFKKMPFQAKLNFYYTENISKNDFSVLDFKLKQLNIHPRIYGKVNNFVWSLSCLYQNVSSSSIVQNIYALNFATQWNFNKKIQLYFKGLNILNLENNQFISQQNTPAFSQLTTFERLEGNIMVGMRYNF